MTEGVLAIIPARGGSRSIPRKNLADLGGIPLIAWTIGAAQGARSVDRVVVSTDDPEIANVSRQWGAEVVERPAEISGDEASSESALEHVLETMRQERGYRPSLVVFLQPTSPFRAPDDIDLAVECLRDGNADSAFSARAVEGFVWRSEDCEPVPLTYDSRRRPRRQDLRGRVLEENGSIYVFKPSVLDETGSRLGGKIAVHVMAAEYSFQIDTPGDLEFMRKLAALDGSARTPAAGRRS